MSMEIITKEELLEKLGGIALSDDELEKISGGGAFEDCVLKASEAYAKCVGPVKKCGEKFKQDRETCNNLL